MCPGQDVPGPPERDDGDHRNHGGHGGHGNNSTPRDDDTDELYEHAPCGLLSTRLDGRIVRINSTLLRWLGHRREDLVGRRTFADLLTVGGKMYHETHFAPLLQMQGSIGGIAMELRRADGTRLPVLVSSTTTAGRDGRPRLIRTALFDARDRRGYENTLMLAHREADEERRRLQKVVTALQRSLLPTELPHVPGLETATLYRMASPEQIGGDFYDLFPLREERWGVFLGDVSGKGPEAASATSLIRYTLRGGAAYATNPLVLLDMLNTVLDHEDWGDEPRYCSVLYGELIPDGDGFALTLAGGGHPPALLLRADGTAGYVPLPDGGLVGLSPTGEFAATRLCLAPGDTLLLYTDGLVEARTDTTGGRYDDEALLAFVRELAPAGASALVAALSDLLTSFGEGLDDDTALLALGVPARSRTGT